MLEVKNLFLSWSGYRSQQVAQVFHDWIPDVLQAVHPWMSTPDIQKGDMWLVDLAAQLDRIRLGIFCLTADNQSSPWMLFEAGALWKGKISKNVPSGNEDSTKIYTFLLDITPDQVKYPFAAFQHTTRDKDNIRRLLDDINRKLGELSIDSTLLNRAFERCWPELDSALDRIPESETRVAPRSTDDMVEEILELSRTHDRILSRIAGKLGEPRTIRAVARTFPVAFNSVPKVTVPHPFRVRDVTTTGFTLEWDETGARNVDPDSITINVEGK